jgi:hypothetical protein
MRLHVAFRNMHCGQCLFWCAKYKIARGTRFPAELTRTGWVNEKENVWNGQRWSSSSPWRWHRNKRWAGPWSTHPLSYILPSEDDIKSKTVTSVTSKGNETCNTYSHDDAEAQSRGISSCVLSYGQEQSGTYMELWVCLFYMGVRFGLWVYENRVLRRTFESRGRKWSRDSCQYSD